jgi:hypothetical protein
MQAVKALYKNGQVQFLSPLAGIEEAELFVIVLDKDQKAGGVANAFQVKSPDSETEFQTAGLNHFFNTEDDNSIDWEDAFDVKPR